MNEPNKFVDGFCYLGATGDGYPIVFEVVKRWDDARMIEIKLFDTDVDRTVPMSGCIYTDYDLNEFTIVHNIMFSANEKTKKPKEPDMVDVVRCDQCFHAQHDQGPGWCTCSIHDLGIISTSWFCADGEVEV